MSEFEVKIRRVGPVSAIEGAGRIEAASISDYRIVTQKGRFAEGDLCVYLGEAAVVPDRVLREGGFWKPCETCEGRGAVKENISNPDAGVCSSCRGRGGSGMLAGSKGNRVKPREMRGVVSEGILLDLEIFERLGFESVMEGLDPHETLEGKDVGAALGIEKYVVPIPAQLSGKVYPLSGTIKGNTAPGNIKDKRNLLVDGEMVVLSEKVHGSATLCGIKDGKFFVTSKGMGAKGLVLEDEKDEQGRLINMYHRAVQSVGGEKVLREISERWGGGGDAYLYGETAPCQGGGFTYGFEPGSARMLAFDIRIGDHFVDHERFVEITDALGIPCVPILYVGPYSPEVVAEHTDGMECVSNRSLHIREGVVVRAEPNRYDERHGRVMLKSISDRYLKRKDRTEYT